MFVRSEITFLLKVHALTVLGVGANIGGGDDGEDLYSVDEGWQRRVDSGVDGDVIPADEVRGDWGGG